MQGFLPYHYKTKNLIRVRDGDTIVVALDLGLRTFREVTIRVADINAPEVYGANKSPEGTLAKEALEKLIEGRTLYLETQKDRKSFDRYVGHIWFKDDDGTEINVSSWMVEHGFAVLSEWK